MRQMSSLSCSFRNQRSHDLEWHGGLSLVEAWWPPTAAKTRNCQTSCWFRPPPDTPRRVRSMVWLWWDYPRPLSSFSQAVGATTEWHWLEATVWWSSQPRVEPPSRKSPVLNHDKCHNGQLWAAAVISEIWFQFSVMWKEIKMSLHTVMIKLLEIKRNKEPLMWRSENCMTTETNCFQWIKTCWWIQLNDILKSLWLWPSWSIGMTHSNQSLPQASWKQRVKQILPPIPLLVVSPRSCQQFTIESLVIGWFQQRPTTTRMPKQVLGVTHQVTEGKPFSQNTLR